MRNKPEISHDPSRDPVYLAAVAVNSLITGLPSGTGHAVGLVLIVMMTGRLAATKGSLARAVLPLVAELKWGWHRVERAMERGRMALDEMFDGMYEWCVANAGVEVVRIGSFGREVEAVDTTTVARWRAGKGLKWIGKGYWGRAGRAVRANVAGAVTKVVMVGGIRLGIVRRVRFGSTSEEAAASVMGAAPACVGKRLQVVDAGIATHEQFSKATPDVALAGRLRKNAVLRKGPPPPTGKRGRPRKFGPTVRPGADEPGVPPDEEYGAVDQSGHGIRVRRWNGVVFPDAPKTVLDVVRVDDPDFKNPLLMATTARELTSEEIRFAYACRWPIETNFYVGQDTTAMEMPRAWTRTATERRIGLALVAGSLLQVIAAGCEAVPTGPWDRRPTPSAGRLARCLNMCLTNFSALALKGIGPRNYRKNQDQPGFNELRQRPAA